MTDDRTPPPIPSAPHYTHAVGPTGGTILVCDRCGTLVMWPHAHTAWHAEVGR